MRSQAPLRLISVYQKPANSADNDLCLSHLKPTSPGKPSLAAGELTHRQYPTWICRECGLRYGRGVPDGHCATFHDGDACGICGNVTATTEPRDFGHLKRDWRKLSGQASRHAQRYVKRADYDELHEQASKQTVVLVRLAAILRTSRISTRCGCGSGCSVR